MKAVEAITDAKRAATSLKGVRLADADLVHTSVLLELDYVEGRRKRALNALPAKPADALKQLALAQSQGVVFSVNKEDNPLVAAQRALQLAEQKAQENRVEAAKANLQQAKNQLVLYRGLVGEHARVTKFKNWKRTFPSFKRTSKLRGRLQISADFGIV